MAGLLMPFPGARVIPGAWSGHHRPTATSTLDATCVITRPSGTGTTQTDGTWTPDAAATVYTGPCRVVAQNTTEGLLIVAGDAQQTRSRYQVSVRHDHAYPKIDDLIEITDSADVGLIGKVLRVVDVRYGSEQWQRDMIAEEMEHTWSPT